MKNFVVEVGDTLSSSTPRVLRPAVLQQLSMKVAFLISHKINQDPQTNFHPQIKLHARFMKKYQTVNCMCQVRIQGAKILISRDRISSFHINGQNWTFTSPKFQHPVDKIGYLRLDLIISNQFIEPQLPKSKATGTRGKLCLRLTLGWT